MVFYCYGDIIHYDHHGFVFVLMLIWCGCECVWREWDTYLLGFLGEGGGVPLWDPDAIPVLTIYSRIILLFQCGCGCVCGCVSVGVWTLFWVDLCTKYSLRDDMFFTVLLLLYLYSSMLPLLFWTVCCCIWPWLNKKNLFYAFIMTNNVNLNFNVNTKQFKTTGWKTAKDHRINLMQYHLKSAVVELRHFKYM